MRRLGIDPPAATPISAAEPTQPELFFNATYKNIDGPARFFYSCEGMIAFRLTIERV